MSLTRPQVFLSRLLLGAALALTTFLATTSATGLPVFSIYDKANHLSAFFTLALLSDFSFPDTRVWWRKALLLVAYGVAIETLQYFLPYRRFDLWDIAADAAGLGLYGLAVPVLRRAPLLRRRWTEE